MEKYFKKNSPRGEGNVFGKRGIIARSPPNTNSSATEDQASVGKRVSRNEKKLVQHDSVCDEEELSKNTIGKKLEEILQEMEKVSRSPPNTNGSATENQASVGKTVRRNEEKLVQHESVSDEEELSKDILGNKLEAILQEIRKNKVDNDERLTQLQEEIRKERVERDKERESMKVEIKKLNEQLKVYEVRMDDLENRSRRQNLIFRGIEESRGETWKESEAKVKEVVKEKFGLELQGIASAHRFGRHSPSWPRSIMVRFEKEKEREVILKERAKLKGSKIFVDEDMAMKTRQKRKNLLKIMREKREVGHKAYVKFDRMVINGEEFKWNLEKDKLEKVERYDAKKDMKQVESRKTIERVTSIKRV